MSKYYNQKTTINGIVFDSRKEARRWTELTLLLKAGQIKDLQRQVKFVLIPAQYQDVQVTDKKGKTKTKSVLVERECSYIADFMYFDIDKGIIAVEDTKGLKTKEYIIKRKLMRYLKNIAITEV